MKFNSLADFSDEESMLKEDIRILIIDDDATIGKALTEALSRAGYKAIHVQKPDEAVATAKYQQVHVAIVDCMLPKINGRDLAKKLSEEIGPELILFLMSGIYKDRSFQRDALHMTKAVGFFTKPFDLEGLIGEIDEKLAPMIDVEHSPLHALLSKEDISHKERIRAVNEMNEGHGFDLPWVISLLMHQRISGHLNIISADGEVSGVGFQSGRIVQVNQEDVSSLFGALLVGNGFITQEEIDEALRTSSKAKKLGERLVEANLLSPHAIQLVMTEQQGIRLSRAIGNTSVRVNFIEASELRENAIIERQGFVELLNDWLVSKFSLDWLKSFYMPWMRYSLRKGAEYSPSHRSLSLPVVTRIPGLVKTLLEADTFEDALMNSRASEDHFFRAVHLLVISRVLGFGEATTKADFDAQKARFTKLFSTLETQNHFERLGVSPKAKDVEIKRNYHELAKVLHPDKFPPETPPEVRELGRLCFNYINTAYQTLSDEDAKATYILELEKGKTESILQAEQLLEQGRSLLSKGDVRKARVMLEEAVTLAPPHPELRLTLIWAKLKTAGADKDLALHESVREQLATIPPEDRHTPMFYFVKGILMRTTGDLEGAKRNFDAALNIASDWIDARREANMVNQELQNSKPKDLLKADLKDVVGMLFNKKKK